MSCVAISTQMDIVLSAAAPPPTAPGAPRRGTCAVWGAAGGHFVRWLPVRGEPKAVAISHTGSGLLVYSEEELDIVEKADYRLGLMHSVRSRAGTDQDSPAGLRS